MYMHFPTFRNKGLVQETFAVRDKDQFNIYNWEILSKDCFSLRKLALKRLRMVYSVYMCLKCQQPKMPCLGKMSRLHHYFDIVLIMSQELKISGLHFTVVYPFQTGKHIIHIQIAKEARKGVFTHSLKIHWLCTECEIDAVPGSLVQYYPDVYIWLQVDGVTSHNGIGSWWSSV